MARTSSFGESILYFKMAIDQLKEVSVLLHDTIVLPLDGADSHGIIEFQSEMEVCRMSILRCNEGTNEVLNRTTTGNGNNLGGEVSGSQQEELGKTNVVADPSMQITDTSSGSDKNKSTHTLFLLYVASALFAAAISVAIFFLTSFKNNYI